MNWKWIYDEIRSLRKVRELSQEYMAEQIGINQKTYSNWENGSKVLNLENLEKIAEALEIDVMHFWNLENYTDKSVAKKYALPVLNKGGMMMRDEEMEKLKERNTRLEKMVDRLMEAGADKNNMNESRGEDIDDDEHKPAKPIKYKTLRRKQGKKKK